MQQYGQVRVKTLVGGPYSNLETLLLTFENFDRKLETGKLYRMQGHSGNLKH